MKYSGILRGRNALSTVAEQSTFSLMNLPEDIQSALAETGYFEDADEADFTYLWLHECRGVTRVQVTQDAITVTEPDGWRQVNDNHLDGGHTQNVGHYLADGC